MTKIVLTGPGLASQAMELAQSAGAEIVATTGALSEDDMVGLLEREQPDAVIVRVGRFGRKAVAASRRLKIIAKHGVGYDNIDVDAASEFGVPVTIAAGANAQSVAEHAFALMFSAARRVAHLDARLRGGHWDKLTADGVELSGKTLGIVGAGAIGLRLAKLVSSLNMKVLAFDPYATPAVAEQVELVRSLDDLLQRADVVSLHCPLTKTNSGLIGRRELAQMKSTGILVNTARGELVDVIALEEALRAGEIFGAGLDTFPSEPAPQSSELWGLSNLVVTPHVGASTREAKDRVGLMAVQQVLDWMNSESISEGVIVNPDYRTVSADAQR